MEELSFDPPRSYLLVSARDPAAALQAFAAWPDAPPDLCVTSPSGAAHALAATVAAEHYVQVLDEATLAGRFPGESEADLAARAAEALRILNAYEGRVVLAIWDELFTPGGRPAILAGEELLGRASAIEREIPLP